jgi:hypothetical protein
MQIGANAVAAELAIQMLDTFDLTGWKFLGETVGVQGDGTVARVLVTPVLPDPGMPSGTGYFVTVTVQTDDDLATQMDVAITQLTALLTGGVTVATGQTPDSSLDGFFAGLNLPPDIAEARKQEVLDERHPSAGQEAPQPPPEPQPEEQQN